MKINGSLVFDASSASVIQNLRVERFEGASVPAHNGAAENIGRVIYVTAAGGGYNANTLYVGGATAWTPLATGGDAAAVSAELEALETALGGAILGDGTFNASAFNTFTNVTAPTTVTDVLEQLDAAISGKDALAELVDVGAGNGTWPAAPTTGQYLRFDGSYWNPDTLTLSDVTDVTATAAEVNVLDGITASTAELNILDGVTSNAADLNLVSGFAATLTTEGKSVSATEFGYLDGVTSPIQTQLDGLQTEDATLTALSALTGPGIVAQGPGDTFFNRTLVAPTSGFAITDANGAAGNPIFALNDDLLALETLADGPTGYGIAVRIGTSQWDVRTITGVNGQISVSDGNGVGGEPTIGLAAVTDSGAGTFLKITRDSFGRVSGTQAVVAGDITGLVDSTYVNVIGDTMTGNLVMSGGATVTGLPAPTDATDAATKAYVDAVAEGLHVHAPTQAVAATTDAAWAGNISTATYANGTAGVGATLTLGSALTTLDGYALQNGDRIMVTGFSGADMYKNGIYVRTSDTVWTRASDFDTTTEVAGGDFVFNQFGTMYASSGYVQTKTTTEIGASPGGDIAFVQFSGQNSYLWGTGLVATGNQIDINLGAGIVQLPTDEVGIHLYSASAGAIILTTDGTTRDTSELGGPGAGSMLHLLLPAGSGLTQDATGLYIPASGVTNAMLANSTIALTADTGSQTLALGGALHVDGDSAAGVSVALTDNAGTKQFAITVADATSGSKGVASFNGTEFSVTAGAVSLGTVPIAKLSTNTIGLIGTNASSGTITLGQSFTFASAVSGLVSAAVASDTVTLDVRLATTTATGVASFNDQHFSVLSGAVSLAASLDDLTNVSGADAGADGSVIQKVAGSYTAVSASTVVGGATLGDLSDVGTAAPTTAGQALIADGTAWQAKSVYYTNTFTGTTWNVAHNLGQKFVNVTVVAETGTPGEYEVVIPQSITFTSATALVVTFNTSVTGAIVVMGVATA